LARVRPDIARYWAVADASVAIPDGAIRLVEGSAEWWRVRASARLIIINDWLRNRYRTRRHQTVLQTWHGTMLKKLALTRSRQGLRPALATIRERSRWDILLAQNGFAASVFRRAYAYFGPIWQEGYPRDDVLVSGDRDAIRSRLGIAPETTVVLYAPTWRDDRPDHVDHLNVARFAAELGLDYITLIRGHSRTLAPGEDVDAHGVLDVTSYPDVSELFLAADILITDYSSVMFDFSVTGKPILFFTPDLERYREVLRGFYFDLLPVAPGPIVQDADELVALVRNPHAVQKEYAAKYAAWREKYNPRDDGLAAERVVARLIREKKI
jgi:CDP-glycerol glycerophosphotransferase (TagB/SpsB family)